MLSPSAPPSDKVSPGRRVPGSGLLSLFSGKEEKMRGWRFQTMKMTMLPSSFQKEWCQ